MDYDSFSRYSLGDLHQLIDWLSRYDAMMQAIPCRPSHVPVAALVDSPDLARFVNENTGKPLDPTYCAVTRALPRLCERYVVGGDGQDGAAAHLKEHCVKVHETAISTIRATGHLTLSVNRCGTYSYPTRRRPSRNTTTRETSSPTRRLTSGRR